MISSKRRARLLFKYAQPLTPAQRLKWQQAKLQKAKTDAKWAVGTRGLETESYGRHGRPLVRVYGEGPWATPSSKGLLVEKHPDHWTDDDRTTRGRKRSKGYAEHDEVGQLLTELPVAAVTGPARLGLMAAKKGLTEGVPWLASKGISALKNVAPGSGKATVQNLGKRLTTTATNARRQLADPDAWTRIAKQVPGGPKTIEMMRRGRQLVPKVTPSAGRRFLTRGLEKAKGVAAQAPGALWSGVKGGVRGTGQAIGRGARGAWGRTTETLGNVPLVRHIPGLKGKQDPMKAWMQGSQWMKDNPVKAWPLNLLKSTAPSFFKKPAQRTAEGVVRRGGSGYTVGNQMANQALMKAPVAFSQDKGIVPKDMRPTGLTSMLAADWSLAGVGGQIGKAVKSGVGGADDALYKQQVGKLQGQGQPSGIPRPASAPRGLSVEARGVRKAQEMARKRAPTHWADRAFRINR